MNTLWLKHLHISLALLSGALFGLRAYWRWTRPERLQLRWVRLTPHVVDSGLLMSAVGLMWLTQQYPLVQHWLTLKLAALLLYIVAGSFALKRGKTPLVRALALLLAVSAFFSIAGIALHHSTTW
ncbi:SirB2 family protein [Undibacterium crateris]|uniref:SirB2 family protein n=1 Tax=Undibacterium crateris TaxID=2528175 RepID=UPI00138A1598|nr:SirB2 family protein [Undibacterium crateris]NDI85340.1 regulator SirB [Undibacterium crateris]